MQGHNDIDLKARIDQLQVAVQTWAQSKDLWHDCGFQTFAERIRAEPKAPAVVSVLHFEGPLFNMFNGTFDDGSLTEFDELLVKLGYEYELADHISAYIFARDPALAQNLKIIFIGNGFAALLSQTALMFTRNYIHTLLTGPTTCTESHGESSKSFSSVFSRIRDFKPNWVPVKVMEVSMYASFNATRSAIS